MYCFCWQIDLLNKKGKLIGKKRLLPLIAGLAVVIIACSPGLTPAPDEAAGAPISEDPGELAPDFGLSVYQGAAELGGETVQFSDVLARGKPVVLNFWAGLCPVCRFEMPDLQAVYEDFDGRFLLVGLDIGPFTNLGSRELGRALLKEVGVTYPVGTTFEAEVIINYRVLGMPTTVFITPEGEIVETWTGLLTKEKMTELIEALLVASGG